MAKSQSNKTEVTVSQVELEISIQATRKDVWKALTEEIHFWWRKDFYASENTKQFVLEPKLGGRMYEDAGNGSGIIWYTVTGVEPLNRLYLVGYIFPGFGGPATSFLELKLHESETRTLLQVSDSILGPQADPSEKEAGWKMLFEEGLKTHIEMKK